MTNMAVYKGFGSRRLHSPRLWTRPDLIEAIRCGERDGFYFFDDFQKAGAAQNSTAHTWSGGAPTMQYLTYATASTTVTASNTAGDYEVGVLEVGGCDADNDEAYISFDDTYCESLCRASSTSGYNFPFWFETRVRFSDVTHQSSKFIGLWEKGVATSDHANGGASLADKSYLGFRALTADPDGMDMVYRNNGGASERVYGEAADYSALNVVAATWKKFGLFYDGSTLHYFVDNVEQGTGVAASATDFPLADPLTLRVGVRCEEAISGYKPAVDWVAFMRLDEINI